VRGLLPRVGLLVGIALLPGCSISCSERGTTGENRLAAHGVSIGVPRGWDGQIFERTSDLPGSVVVQVASFALRAEDDDWASKAQMAMGSSEVLLVISETLPHTSLPSEWPRVEPGERRATIDRYFLSGGRAFMLHVAFGSRPPPADLIRRVNAMLANLSIEPRARPLQPAPDPPPTSALAPARLLPTPVRVLNQCRLAQARAPFPILCPSRLPRPFIGWPRGEPPEVVATTLPASNASWQSRADPRYRKRGFSGVSIGYGAPWEPDSGPDWRLHLWRNRPCCFLHFEVFRREEGRRQIPAGARPATLGGQRGLLKDATSYGLASRENDYLYWANHTRFLWRENGVPYVATLHRFGTKVETRALLGQLIRELRAANDLG